MYNLKMGKLVLFSNLVMWMGIALGFFLAKRIPSVGAVVSFSGVLFGLVTVIVWAYRISKVHSFWKRCEKKSDEFRELAQRNFLTDDFDHYMNRCQRVMALLIESLFKEEIPTHTHLDDL